MVQKLLAVSLSPPWRSDGECTFLCVHGGGGKVLPLPQRCTLLWHMKRQPFLCNGRPCQGHCHCNHRCHLCLHCQLRRHCQCRCPLPSPLPSAIAIAVAIDHCRRHLCCVPVSHRCCCRPCRQPMLSLSVGHHRCHRRQPFLRVVALAWGELYSNNLSKECLPYFILFWQWAVHWSKPDDWPGVKRQWPTPALSGKQQAVSG